MISCWLCSKTFPNKTALNTHLTSKEHRRQTVICVWCPSMPRENTFTKPGDLASHCKQYHFKETKNLSKSISNCFYFSVFPNDYAAITSRIESWTSPNAIEARGLVRKYLEKQPGASVKLELWQQGWKVATRAKVRTNGGPDKKRVDKTEEGGQISFQNKSEGSGVEKEEQNAMNSVEAMKEVKEVSGKQKGEIGDIKVSEKALELEGFVEIDREAADPVEVINESKTSKSDTEMDIQEIDTGVEVERASKDKRDELSSSRIKENDNETKNKQEVEKLEDKVESDRQNMETEVNYGETSNESKCNDVVVHKPKKHKHKSKRSHEDSDRKMKKVKTKKMKTDISQSETKENHKPEGKNLNVRSERKPLMSLEADNVNSEKQVDRNNEETRYINKTTIRCIEEFETYVKDLTYDADDHSINLRSGQETPLLDEKINLLEGELDLVREILAEDKTIENRKCNNTDVLKDPKKVKIRYEEYKAKQICMGVGKSKGSDRKLDGEERVVTEKGDSVSLFQGEDNIWRRKPKPAENLSNEEETLEKVADNEEEVESTVETESSKERKPEGESETGNACDRETGNAVETRGSGENEIAEIVGTESANDQVNPDFATRAISILKRGVMPFCPPARRQWGIDSNERILAGGLTMIWPPKGWHLMTPDRKLLATETMAMTLEGYFYGNVDTEMSRSYLLDKYNYLILPGSNHHYKEKTEMAATKSRYYNYQLLKEIANGKKTSFAEQQQLSMLEILMQNQILPYDLSVMSVPLRLNQEEVLSISNPE